MAERGRDLAFAAPGSALLSSCPTGPPLRLDGSTTLDALSPRNIHRRAEPDLAIQLEAPFHNAQCPCASRNGSYHQTATQSAELKKACRRRHLGLRRGERQNYQIKK